MCLFPKGITNIRMVGEFMYFDYQPYKAYCFEAPAFGVLWFSIVFLCFFYKGVRLILKKQKVLDDILKCLFFAVMLGFILCIDIGVLLHGGIHLIYEEEADAVEIQGEIQYIRGLGLFSFPRVDCNYEYGEFRGYEFNIDSIQCTAVVKGSLEVGDYVEVKYLPKSGYVLHINKIDLKIVDIE